MIPYIVVAVLLFCIVWWRMGKAADRLQGLTPSCDERAFDAERSRIAERVMTVINPVWDEFSDDVGYERAKLECKRLADDIKEGKV